MTITSKFQRTAAAAVGAMLISTTFIAAAVAPARSAETQQIAASVSASVQAQA